jgi:hypothetical protein
LGGGAAQKAKAFPAFGSVPGAEPNPPPPPPPPPDISSPPPADTGGSTGDVDTGGTGGGTSDASPGNGYTFIGAGKCAGSYTVTGVGVPSVSSCGSYCASRGASCKGFQWQSTASGITSCEVLSGTSQPTSATGQRGWSCYDYSPSGQQS